jgi:RNA polymerase sigma factor (sigma-70 family)
LTRRPTHHVLTTLLTHDGPRLYALLTRLTTRQGDPAADLLQELFLRLAQSPTFPSTPNPQAYAFRTAINLAMEWRRHRLRTHRLPPTTPPPQPDTLSQLIATEDATRILDALPNLPDLPRTCFILRLIDHQPYETIGAQVNKTPHQTRALCHSAIRQLRTLLNETPQPKEPNHV